MAHSRRCRSHSGLESASSVKSYSSDPFRFVNTFATGYLLYSNALHAKEGFPDSRSSAVCRRAGSTFAVVYPSACATGGPRVAVGVLGTTEKHQTAAPTRDACRSPDGHGRHAPPARHSRGPRPLPAASLS